MEEATELLKTHTLGRMRLTTEQRQALLDQFDRNGVSASRFAVMSGINYPTLAGWLQRRRQSGQVGMSLESLGHMEVEMSAPEMGLMREAPGLLVRTLVVRI